MSQKFQELMDKIALAVENRTIVTTPKKTREYEIGAYSPMFSLINRKGELLCIWCSNRKGDDIEIARFHDIGKGFDVDSKSPRSWEIVTLKVMHSLGLKL